MTHKLLRLLSAAAAIMLVLSALPLSAAPASDIPAKMLDNIFLDALTYTGYKTETQKADGSIFKTYGTKTPSSVLSGIGYGTGPSGLETVPASGKTGKAPDISKFKANGLCCASYVSYVYYNYLPNVANRDVTAFPCPSNPRSSAAYNTAANSWVQSGGARRIGFTQSGSTFTPAEEIPIGSLVIFKNISTGAVAHAAIYAGTYKGKHFVTHVGDAGGPEISTIEGMSKGSYPEAVVQIVVPKIGEPTGSIAVYKTDENGRPLAGARFSATWAEHPENVFLLDTTDQNGKGKLNFGVPYGTYIIREVTLPEGYTYSGQTEWTVKVCDETQDVLIRAVNKLKSAKIRVIKTDCETGQTVKGITDFKIRNVKTGEESKLYYTDENGALCLPESLTYGSYELIEVSPPKGYLLNSTPVSFSIDGNSPEVTIRLPDKPQKGRISVIKMGEVFSSVQEENGKYTPVYSEKGLKGAEFEVTAAEDIFTPDGTLRIANGALADTLVTDETGSAISCELYPGKYLLREKTAPDGFVLDTEIKELTVTSGIVKTELKNERKKQEFKIQKKLETDEKYGIGFNGEIFNTKFGLYSKTELTALDGSVIPADGLIETTVPDENGFLSFSADMPLNAECYIKEIQTDEHYILSGEYFNSGDTAENMILRGNIQGLKTDPNGRVLNGAVIGLFHPFETEFLRDTAIEVCKTDEVGRFLFENVPFGDWIICELKAPEGYVLSDEAFKVNIAEGGETVKLNIQNSKVPEKPAEPQSPKTGDGNAPYVCLILMLSALSAALYLQNKLKNKGV